MKINSIKSVLYFAVVVVLLVLMIVLVITGGKNKELRNMQDEPAVSPTVDPYSLTTITQADKELYNISDDALMPEDTPAPAQQSFIPENAPQSTDSQELSGIPENAVIINEDVSPASGEEIVSGSFSSDTGTYLNLAADWTASVYDYDTVRLTVTVSIEHSSLNMASVPAAVTVTVDGSSASLDVPAVNFAGGITSTEVGSCSFKLPVRTSSVKEYPIRVDWNFGGSYSGVSLSTVTAAGTAVISR